MQIFRWVLVFAIAIAACNREKPQPRAACSSDGELGSLCGFENPEDIVYVPGHDLLVVSNLRINDQGGFLSAVSPEGGTPIRMWPNGSSASDGKGGVARIAALGEPGCSVPDPVSFAPHGIYLDVRDPVAPLLYVVNHGGRESVEIFSFGRRGEEPLMFWTACIELPEDTSGNDVVVAADGEVIVSNYVPPTHKTWSHLKIGLGWDTGDILAWNLSKRWRHIPGTAASGPNGVEISPDDKWIFYSETGGAAIHRVGRDGSEAQQTKVKGLPDNLTWSSRGSLLLASHQSALSFVQCARSQPCRSPWLALEVDAQTLQSNELLQHDGSVVGAVATVFEHQKHMYFSAVFGDRIGLTRNLLAAR